MPKKKQPDKAKHLHKIMKFPPVWKCVNTEGGDCKYFVYFTQEYIILGRQMLCWQCGAGFIINEESLKEDQPRCDACRAPEIMDIDIDDIISARLK